MTMTRKTQVAALSVASNALLTFGKLGIGLYIGAVSVVSEAIHSGLDMLAAAIALWAVWQSSKPADREHPFGHGKYENISGAIEALLIFIAAGWIVYEAVRKVVIPASIESINLGFWIMVFSVVVNIIVSSMLFRVGRSTQSQALLADAWHLRTDVYTSMGVMAGLGIIWAGRQILPAYDWRWIDPAAAIFVALLIIKTAFRLTREALDELLDSSIPDEEIDWIRDFVKKSEFPVASLHSLKTRRSGRERFIEFHLALDSAMSVEDSHAITEVLEESIKEKFGNAQVTIHVEPCQKEHCDSSCRTGCQVLGS